MLLAYLRRLAIIATGHIWSRQKVDAETLRKKPVNFGSVITIAFEVAPDNLSTPFRSK